MSEFNYMEYNRRVPSTEKFLLFFYGQKLPYRNKNKRLLNPCGIGFLYLNVSIFRSGVGIFDLNFIYELKLMEK